MIDIGRFYYPNVIKNNFGEYKPEAFRGYRHKALEFLVAIYALLDKNDYCVVGDEVEFYERRFTSIVFVRINPRERNNKYSKYVDEILPNDMTIQQYYQTWRYSDAEM